MAEGALGSQIVGDIGRLVGKQRARKTLRAIDPRGALAARRGLVPWIDSRPTGNGVGVAWPLTEEDYGQREYYPEGQLSSDGIFVIPAVKKIVFTDADGNSGSVHLAEPT